MEALSHLLQRLGSPSRSRSRPRSNKIAIEEASPEPKELFPGNPEPLTPSSCNNEVVSFQNPESESTPVESGNLHNERSNEAWRETAGTPSYEEMDFGEKIFDPHRHKKFHPRLHWEPKTPIVYLDAITEEDHYQAFCKDHKGRIVDGRFFFHPPIGTVFSAGNHELQVNFIPEKGFKYYNVQETRTIEVQKKKPKMTWYEETLYLKYLLPLPQEYFNHLACELKDGSFHFSHTAGTVLEVGIHTINAKYEPGLEESKNYCRGYAKMTVHIIGTVVPLIWDFPSIDEEEVVVLEVKRRKSDIGRFGQAIRYKDPLPQWIFGAICAVEGIDGDFVYSIPRDAILPAGRHSISVEFLPHDSRKYFKSTATRSFFIHKAPLELVWEKPFPIPDGELLNEYTLNCKTAIEIDGTFEYNPGIGAGLTEGMHTLHVKFTPFDTNYLPAEMTQQMKILPKRSLRILWFEPENMIHPTPLSRAELNAALVGFGSNQKGTFVYDPDFGEILDAGSHTLRVKFFPENPSFAVAQQSVVVKVLQGPSRLSWNAPDTILEGEALYENILNCICTNVDKGKFIYTPPMGTTLGAGNHKLKVEFIPDNLENFSPCTATANLLVRERPRFTPRLVWKDPVSEPIVYGTPLLSEMLNAKCNNAAGGFEYEPALGTILPVGRHKITAVFTPFDTAKCLSGTITSTVSVFKRRPHITWKPSIVEMTYGDLIDAKAHLNALVVMGEDDSSHVAGEYTYKPLAGTLLQSGDHILRCSFLPKDSVNLYPVQTEVTIFIRRAFPELIWEKPAADLVFPAVLAQHKFQAKCKDSSIEGHFEYDFDPNKVFDAGEHTLGCHFYPKDIINYFGASATLTITVKKASPILVWDPNTSLIYGDRISVSDHCNGYVDIAGGKFTYDPPVGTLLSSGGNIKMTLTYEPDDSKNYCSVTSTRFLQVEKRMPVLEWPCPARIPYGTILSKKELCAAIAVRENSKLTVDDLAHGEFVYTPVLGTKLNSGKGIELAVTFFPPKNQLHNYFSIGKSVRIDVIPRQAILRWKPKLTQLVEGEELNGSHLNAYVTDTKLFVGEIVYSMPTGTLLPPGRHQIEVQFIPENSENCIGCTLVQFFDVNKKPPKLVWELDPLSGQMKCVKKYV